MSNQLSIDDVVQRFRDLELGRGGGVLPVVLRGEGIPERLVGGLAFAAGVSGFTPEAVEIMNELRQLEQTNEGREVLVEAYERFQTEEEEA